VWRLHSLLQCLHSSAPPRSSQPHSLASRFRSGPSPCARRQVHGNYAQLSEQACLYPSRFIQVLPPVNPRSTVWRPGLGRPAGEPTISCGTTIVFSPDLEARRLSRLTPRLQSVICTAVIAKRQNYCTPICLFASK
jgi:hypothetical protein